ncbi:type III secretion system protein [Erwiniaceae bacterium BAC15a-03b]|uniref:Type III secretion system protein n=1 Tax=Winslowiella arboricola TaxID=2978220 RepID=A0A9J6PJC4_9GAMM|nr:type III secretion system protein [Winslowiella arboricola]MCU5773676.1 type III secretion system protein [Winslowiella arboricola]MCU5778425.1 type III secretion system protein [Winslowiella arboricola]
MRRHINVESDIPEVSDTEALQKTFALLLPIRRQRLNRSERAQREQERALQAADSQSAAAQQQLARHQQHYQQLRDSFAAGLQQQENLRQELHQERQAGEAVLGQKRELINCQQQQSDQQQRLSEAQQETRSRQRELEKLEYLMQESEGLQ